MIDIAEEEPKMGTEAPERDRDLPPLPSPAVGVRSVVRIGREVIQMRRSPCKDDEIYNAGYGDGYVDGYDDGRFNTLMFIRTELEEQEWDEGIEFALQLVRDCLDSKEMLD